MSSHECNKYIIKNDKFIRNFESMYQTFQDPWHLKKMFEEDILNHSSFYYLQRVIELKKIEIKDVLDIGCADAVFTPLLISGTASKNVNYLGTDISPTVINRAKRNPNIKELKKVHNFKFQADDIRKLNESLIGRFDLVYSGRTLYYVGPEIDEVINNVNQYLKDGAVFCYTYNQTEDAFSKKFLTYEKLRRKLLKSGFEELLFIEINRFSYEIFNIGMFRKVKKQS